MKKDALAVKTQSTSIAKIVNETDKYAEAAFQRMSSLLAKQLPPTTLMDVWARVNKWLELVEDNFRSNAKRQVIELLKKEGGHSPNSTRRFLHLDGLELSMHAHKTGTDPKKLERLLRAKQLDPTNWMTLTISYKVDKAKVQLLLLQNKLTQSELDGCQYEENWSVQAPHPIGAQNEYGDSNE